MLILASLLVAGPIVGYGQQPELPSKAESGNASNLVAAAIRFYDLKQYDLAIKVATNAANLLPMDHRPWAIIGNCYLAQWKMKSGSYAFAKAAKINPRVKGLWYIKAYADRMRNAQKNRSRRQKRP